MVRKKKRLDLQTNFGNDVSNFQTTRRENISDMTLIEFAIKKLFDRNSSKSLKFN